MKKIYHEKFHMISKLFVYQIAMSLLGVFIVSPFSGNTCIVAGVFASLFYLSLVSYAAVEDGQKDCISHNAGRLQGSALTGFGYAFISYIPTIAITVISCILRIFLPSASLVAVKNILNIIIRFFLMGTYLGIDVGLTGYTYDANTQSMVSDASVFVRYICDNGILFVVLLFVMPVVCGIAYKLAFNGKISINTHKKQK